MESTNLTGVQQKISSFFHDFKAQSFDSGAVVIRAGQKVDSVFYLESGVVQQVSLAKNGNRSSITLFKEGAFFPLIWALTQRESPYDFEALTAVKVRKAPAEKVSKFLQENADVSFSLNLRLLSALEGLSEKIQHTAHSNSVLRLVQLFIMLSYRFGKELDGGVVIPLALTHQKLAEMTGLSRESVTRHLSILKKDGVVSMRAHQYCLPDRRKLEQML